jgi:enamine deaminase RidA (YjgF/YER057c/UK114 family)
MAEMDFINPKELAAAVGFAHGVAISNPARFLFLAGQCAHDSQGTMTAPGDLVAQFDRVLTNFGPVLRDAGLGYGNVVRLDIFVLSRDDYLAKLKPLGQVYRRHFSRHFPAMALLEVRGLFDPLALVEVTGIACG